MLEQQQLIEEQGFTLIAQLYESSRVTTWKAVQRSLDRTVSLSVLKEESAANPDEVRHFLAISRIIAKLKSPYVSSVFDIVSSGGLHYIVTEYVDGPTLAECVEKNGPFSIKDLMRITCSICDGMEALWNTCRIVHRNIKGRNILLGPHCTVKITDFGVAIQARAVDHEGLYSDSGVVVGTPFFLSPEQATGSADLNTQSDMYSVGMLLYFLATGRRPFDDGRDLVSVIHAQVHDKLEPPHRTNPNLPVAFSWLLHRLMMKDPRHRYASWRDIKADAEAILAGEKPSCIRPDETASSTLNVAGMETEDNDRQRVKIIRPQEAKSSSPLAAETAKPKSESHPGVAFLQFLMWLLLLCWFAAVYFYRTLPGDSIADKIAALIPSRTQKSAEPVAVNTPPAQESVPKESVPAADTKPEENVPDNGAELLAALTPKLAKAFAAGDMAAAAAAVEELPEAVPERLRLSGFLKRVPLEPAMVMRLMDKNVGKEIRLSRNGRTRMVTLRAITEQTLYIELHGRAAEISMDKLTADDLLPLMSKPETPEDALVYTLMLLRSSRYRNEVPNFAEQCPLFKQALLDADKLLPAPSAQDTQGE